MAKKLRHNHDGSVLIEFALLAPAFIIMLVGVFQAALMFQSYNAIRSLSMDAARYVTVQYQKSNDISDEQIRTAVLSRARVSPYLLDVDRVDVAVAQPTTRITGTKEINVQISYLPPNYLGLPDLDFFELTYSKPVFVVDPA